MKATDLQLFNLIKRDDRNAFGELYNRYYYKLYSYLHKHNQSDENEDLIQDVFSDIWMFRKKMKVTGNVTAFMYVLIKHKLYNYRRSRSVKEKYEGLVMPDRQYIEHHADVMDVKRMIKKGLEKMPYRQQRAFRLSRFQYMTNKEIAEKMHISIRVVENYISLSLSKLRPINDYYMDNH